MTVTKSTSAEILRITTLKPLRYVWDLLALWCPLFYNQNRYWQTNPPSHRSQTGTLRTIVEKNNNKTSPRRPEYKFYTWWLVHHSKETLQPLKNVIYDTALMVLGHFNDEGLIYKLIFADVLDVHQRRNTLYLYDLWEQGVWQRLAARGAEGAAQIRDIGCSQCSWHE